MDAITLQYRPSLKPALRNVSFEVKSGEHIGIVGMLCIIIRGRYTYVCILEKTHVMYGVFVCMCMYVCVLYVLYVFRVHSRIIAYCYVCCIHVYVCVCFCVCMYVCV